MYIDCSFWKKVYLRAVAFDTDSLVLRYSPGNSPNERTLPSRSSSMSDSGVTLKCYRNSIFNMIRF